MKTEIVAAVIAAVIAAVASIVSVYFSARSPVRVAQLQREERQEERKAELEQLTARFRDPLGQAAYDLQSRLFNILRKDFIGSYVERGDERSRTYALNNTVFLIAQYFAWMEIIREEIQFIDLGEDDTTQSLAHLRDDIHHVWQTDTFYPLFRVFAGEQRAIGELMIREGPRGLQCIGYAEFLNYVQTQEDLLLNELRTDVLQLSTMLPEAQPRLVALQHVLIDLLRLLDPECIRFPQEKRTKVQ